MYLGIVPYQIVEWLFLGFQRKKIDIWGMQSTFVEQLSLIKIMFRINQRYMGM